MQNRPEGCIRQTFSVPLKQRFTKIITVSLGGELVRVHVSMFWLGASSENIYNTIKVCNISFDTSYDKTHNLSPRFIDFEQQYKQDIYRKGLCNLLIATSRLYDKSEEICVKPHSRKRDLRICCEFSKYDFVITNGKDREHKEKINA